jgi:cytochrome c oxidase cbb3-type subunit 3/ubiquinol-cytochrome c reductase cytochrome c subunit
MSPDQSLEFGVLYGQNCAGCHGGDGKVGPAPPLNDPLFRAIVPEGELQRVLVKGRKAALMPAFAKENGGMLTEAQIQVLVMEIKGIRYKIVKKHEGDAAKVEVVPDSGGIAPAWGNPEKPPKGVPSYSEPSESPNGNRASGKRDTHEVGRGAVVFVRACAACHGDHGQGIREEGETVRTIHEPSFLALTSNQALRRYAITGRPDLGMPNYAQARPGNPNFVPLTDREVDDLVELLASWRKEK